MTYNHSNFVNVWYSLLNLTMYYKDYFYWNILFECSDLCEFSVQFFILNILICVSTKQDILEITKKKRIISSILLNDDKHFLKQDFLIVDLKVDSNLWTSVYVCESLQAQAAKNMIYLFYNFCME